MLIRFGTRFVYIMILSLISAWSSIALAAKSCECEKIECSPCEFAAGTHFYTEPCEGGQMKSCQRPQCEPLRDPPPICKVSKAEVTTTTRLESQVVPAASERKVVGVIVVGRGDAQIHRPEGVVAALVGKSLSESDVVVTGQQGQVRVQMADKNILMIGPNSRMKIRSFSPPDSQGHSLATLDLIYGKIRSQVNNRSKFPGKPHFQIRTPAAVAGVRGTDFVVTHLQNGDMTKVETLEGSVQLAGHGAKESALIKKGQVASYVAVGSSNPGAVFRDDDIATFVQAGFLTPVVPLSSTQLENILVQIDYQEDDWDRQLASAKPTDGPLCSAPAATFNQCAWSCRGNPQGAQSCRTDLPGVQCVRSRCDAAGKWRSQERPAGEGRIKCEPESTIVGPCDY